LEMIKIAGYSTNKAGLFSVKYTVKPQESIFDPVSLEFCLILNYICHFVLKKTLWWPFVYKILGRNLNSFGKPWETNKIKTDMM
jgi:hypothetical protein